MYSKVPEPAQQPVAQIDHQTSQNWNSAGITGNIRILTEETSNTRTQSFAHLHVRDTRGTHTVVPTVCKPK